MSFRRLLSLWFFTSRPLLYPLLPLIFVLGYQAAGGVLTTWSLLEWGFVLCLTWPVGMIIYGINDIYDWEIDTAVKRSRLDGGRHQKNETVYIWWGVSVATLALLLAGVTVYGLFGFVFSIAVVFASVVYSMPPFRFKSRAGFDVLFSGLMYVGLVYGAGYWLMKPYDVLPDVVFILMLFAACLHALGTLRDYTADKQAGERTLAVALSPRYTAIAIVITSVVGMALWYQTRGIDIGAHLVFASITMPALLTIKQPNERLIRYAMRLIACVVGLVGLYKIFY